MKLKGLTKLALSGVALAAVAATLGTSTYAWYISNDTATVSGAEGSTAAASATGSIYAASLVDHAKGDWKNEINLIGGSAANLEAGTVDYNNTVQLNPVTKATDAATLAYNKAVGNLDENGDAIDGKTAIAPNAGSFVDSEGNVQSNAYLEFNFYLVQRGAAAGQVHPKLTIANNTDVDDAKPQTAYANQDLPTKTGNNTTVSPAIGNAEGRTHTFAVDAVHALRVEVSYTNAFATKAGAEKETPATSDYVAAATYAADTAFETYVSPTGYVYEGAANQYYNDIVKGVNLYGCGAHATNGNLCADVDAPEGSWSDFYLKKDEETLVTVKVWLEGTDKDCYDSCIAQAFTFDFAFELVKSNS